MRPTLELWYVSNFRPNQPRLNSVRQVASIGSAYVDYRQLIVGNNLTGEYIASKSESALTTTLLDIGICKELHVTSVVKMFMGLKSGDEANLAAAMLHSSS